MNNQWNRISQSIWDETYEYSWEKMHAHVNDDMKDYIWWGTARYVWGLGISIKQHAWGQVNEQ